MHEEALLLLRLWRNGIQDPDDWRASVQNVRTRETVRFASLDALLHYLEHRQWRSGSKPRARDRPKGIES